MLFPQGVTIPEVFWPMTKDDQLKAGFINYFSKMLERSWNPNDESTKYASEIKRQFIETCNLLKRRNYSIRQIVHKICIPLNIIPPKKYWAV